MNGMEILFGGIFEFRYNSVLCRNEVLVYKNLELMDPEALDGNLSIWGDSGTLSSVEEANGRCSGNEFW